MGESKFQEKWGNKLIVIGTTATVLGTILCAIGLVLSYLNWQYPKQPISENQIVTKSEPNSINKVQIPLEQPKTELESKETLTGLTASFSAKIENHNQNKPKGGKTNNNDLALDWDDNYDEVDQNPNISEVSEIQPPQTIEIKPQTIKVNVVYTNTYPSPDYIPPRRKSIRISPPHIPLEESPYTLDDLTVNRVVIDPNH